MLKLNTTYRLVLIGIGFSCLFFLAGFSFDNFTTSAHSYYASEIVCSGPSRINNCEAAIQEDIRLFRGNSSEPTKITDYGNRYTSHEFARFLNLFVGSSDDFRSVILKTYIVKSLIAGYLLLASLFLMRRFDYIRNLATRFLLLMFSVPYLFFGVSDVYSAPIAIMGMFLALLILKIFVSESSLPLGDHIFLGLNFFVSTILIMSLRFETTAYLGFTISILMGLVVLRRVLKMPGTMVVTPTAIYAVILVLFAVRNDSMRSWISEAFFFQAKVFTPETAETSKAVQVLGDLGFAALSAVSLGVNSTSNMDYQFLNEFADRTDFSGGWQVSFSYLRILFICCSWSGLVIVFLQALRVATSPFFRFRRYGLDKRLNSLPSLLVLLALVFVPYFARVSWFLWYVMPLIMVFLFFTEVNILKSKYLIYLACLVAAVNFLAFTMSNYAFGHLVVGGMHLSWIWLSLAVLVISLFLISQISFFFGELESE